MSLVVISNDLAQRCTSQQKARDGRCADESEKITIVASTDTVVDPYTVMVQSVNTVVANTTMIASRRSPYVASFAILHGHIHSCGCGSCKANHDPVISWRSKGQWIIVLSGREGMNVSWENLKILATLPATLKLTTYTRVNE